MKKRTILSIAAALLVSFNAGAFGFETVENAAETSFAETGAALTEEIDIPLVDEKYGDLIWYSNFDSTDDYKTATYLKEGVDGYVAGVFTKSVTIVQDPTGKENKCLELTPNGYWSALEFHSPNYQQPGKYTLVIDVFFPVGTANPGVLGRYEGTGGTAGNGWSAEWKAHASETGKWQTYACTFEIKPEWKSLKDLAARRWDNKTEPYYCDNFRIYCNPTAGENQVIIVDGASRSFINVDDEGYTFPEPADKTDFLAWYCEASGQRYAAGEKASKADILGKTFVSFHQNAEAPAMGFAFEGDTTAVCLDAGARAEVITDENRTVLRHWQQPGKRWDAANNKYLNDQRFYLIPYLINKDDAAFVDAYSFDPNEYNIVSYCYKITKAVNAASVAPDKITESDLTANEKPWFGINYSTSNEYKGWFENGGEHMIGGRQTTTVGDYHIFTADMSDASNSLKACPWNSVNTMYGFAVEPCASNYEAITYIDYLRVYRDGIMTVTYDTNAAKYEAMGYTVQHEVAAETGRGLGTGYLLTGDKPQIKGLAFVGWALTPDATPADVVTSIDLTGDTTVYAVWTEDGKITPRTINKNSLRTGAVSGIRFASIIDLSVKAGLSDDFKGVEPDEYGFIVSRKALLNGETLTFGTAPNEKGVGVTPNGATYVSGVAFDKAKGINRVYDNDGSKFSEVTAGKNEAFTAILTGIPEENYGDTLVARPYLKIGGLYFYGRAREMSMKSVAEDLKANYDSLTDAEKELVDKILAA